MGRRQKEAEEDVGHAAKYIQHTNWQRHSGPRERRRIRARRKAKHGQRQAGNVLPAETPPTFPSVNWQSPTTTVHNPMFSCTILFNNSPIDQSVDSYCQCGKPPSTRTTCKHTTARQIRGTRREWVRPGRWLRGKTHDGMGEGGNDGDGWGSPWGQGGESGASLVNSPLRLTWVPPPFPLSLQPTQPLLSLPVSRIIRWRREMDYAAKPTRRTTHSQKPG